VILAILVSDLIIIVSFSGEALTLKTVNRQDVNRTKNFIPI
jgi:hypothetical protein